MVDLTKRRRIDDTGQKIGGARKDFAREKLGLSDLADMTDVEMATMVEKDAVWPKPDYAALVEGGMARDAAALVKIIRDRVAKTAAVSASRPHATSLGWYVDTLSRARDALEACRTLAQVAAVHGTLYEEISRRNSDIAFFKAEGRYRFDVIRKGKSNPLYNEWEDSARIRQLLDKGFPEDQPAWKKGFVVKRYNARPDFWVTKGKVIVSKGHETEQAALDWLKADHERRLAEASAVKSEKKKAPDRPHLKGISREGMPDWRLGNDVSPQTFIDVFGFRAVEFGEWLPDDERQAVLNLGYDAFMDFAQVLGFDPGQISLDGTLAIAFGARGKGNAAAHYESGRRVVNLTRLSGAGTIAHEWGHALDHFLGTGADPTSTRLVIPSLTGWRERLADCRAVLAHRGPAVAGAAQAVLDTINFRPKTRDERLGEITARIAQVEASILKGRANLAAHVAGSEEGKLRLDPKYVRDMNRWLVATEQSLEASRRALENESAKAPDADYGRRQTSFRNEAEAISGEGGYWNRPNELFARAFEAHVTEALREAGGESNYLVAFAEARFYPTELYAGNPYPSGDELERLRAAYGTLVARVAPLVENCATAAPVHISYPEPSISEQNGPIRR